MRQSRLRFLIGVVSFVALPLTTTLGCSSSGGDRASVSPERRVAAERADLRDAAVEMLQQLVRSPDALTRANAIEALEQSPLHLDAVAADALLDDNIGVRSIAAVAVGRAGLRGHEQLLRGMLSDESEYARASAIFALAMFGQEVDRSPLAAYLMNGEPFGLRGHTAYLLGELGDPSAIELLRDAADAPMGFASTGQRRFVELQLSEAMVKLGDLEQMGPVRAALFPSQPSDLEAMAIAIQIVGEVGDTRSRGRLVQIAETEDNTGQRMPPEVQLAIAISMAKLGDFNGWFVADEFWDAQRDVLRADSAAVYGWTGREADLKRLRTMLDDRSGRVRASAAAGILRATAGNAGSGRLSGS